MLTERQLIEEVIHRGSPDRFARQYDFVTPFIKTPILKHRNNAQRGQIDVANDWGVTVSWPEDQPGAFPNHREDLIVMPEVEEWRETVKAPKNIYGNEEWEEFERQAEAIDTNEHFLAVMELPGIFELCHYLGGITNILMAFYESPDDLKDLIRFITEWKLGIAEGICEHLHPEVMFLHDDWGTNTSTFTSPEMFEEFFLPAYKELYGYYHDHGVKYIIHHSDSYAETLVPYMIEMGVNIWQGVMSTNDIPGMIAKYGDKITFMGGLDSTVVDTPDWSPEAIKAQVKKVCTECGPLSFIPCQTQGMYASTFPGVYDAINDAIDEFSAEYFKTFDRAAFA